MGITSLNDFPMATNQVLREASRPPKFDQDTDLLVLLQDTKMEGSFENAVITIFFCDWFTQNALNTTTGWTSINKQMEEACLLYTSPSPRDLSTSRMPSSA